MRFIAFLLGALFSSFALSNDDITAQGFHWYTSEDETITEVVKPQKHQLSTPKTNEPYQELIQKRRQLNNTLAEALLRPSFDSTKKYMEAQQELTKKNQKFVRYWQQVLVSNPELDYSLNAPTDNSAIEEINNEKSQFIEKLLNLSSTKYGLIFVYQGKSLASIRFSNLLKIFKRQYKFSIAPISIDDEIVN